jgi:hypothetical protein
MHFCAKRASLIWRISLLPVQKGMVWSLGSGVPAKSLQLRRSHFGAHFAWQRYLRRHPLPLSPKVPTFSAGLTGKGSTLCAHTKGWEGGAERQRATFAWSPFCPPPPSTNPGTRSLDTNFNLWRVVYSCMGRGKQERAVQILLAC